MTPKTWPVSGELRKPAAGRSDDALIDRWQTLLLDCLHPDRVSGTVSTLRSLSVDDWQGLFATADRALAGPLLARRLASAPVVIPESIARMVKERRRRYAVATLRVQSDFRDVVRALQLNGIRVIALKGLTLVDLYGDSAARESGDIDLLVQPTDLHRAGTVIRACGYRPLAPYRVSAGPRPYWGQHLPRFVRCGATSVEIHWTIFDATRPVVPDIAPFWSRQEDAGLRL